MHRLAQPEATMLRSRRNPENAFYIEPRSGERYPLDVPR